MTEYGLFEWAWSFFMVGTCFSLGFPFWLLGLALEIRDGTSVDGSVVIPTILSGILFALFCYIQWDGRKRTEGEKRCEAKI